MSSSYLWRTCCKHERRELLSDVVTDTPLPLTAHLEELRSRIIASVVWALLFSIVAFFFVDRILEWLSRPVGQFVFTGPTEAFFVHIQVALVTGGIVALPIWVYHLWRYVGRALHIRERSVIAGILPSAIALFFLGMAIAVFVVIPAAMKFLLSYSSPTLKPMISLSEYLSFLFWMIVGFGIFFQLPLVIVTLARFGLVNPKVFVKYRRHMIVAIFIVAAVLTPGPDIVSQLVLAIPSYLLFEISLFIAKRVYKRK